MPFKSEAQRRKFFAMAARGEISKETLEEWQDSTGDKDLPEKVASRLRQAVRVVEVPVDAVARSWAHPGEGARQWLLRLGDRDIGRAVVRRSGQVADIGVKPGFRGMGLGKKFYGELARRFPGGISSDVWETSKDATNIWRGMARRGYNVRTNPRGWRFEPFGEVWKPVQPVGQYIKEPAKAPIFRASLPEAAMLKAGHVKVGPPPKRNRKEWPYQGSISFRGLDILVENKRGTDRVWTDENNKETGRTRMHHHYGEVRRTMGPDGDPVDVFVGPDSGSDVVYIVHQMKRPKYKEYDEDKCMLGFRTAKEAKAAYLMHYDDDRFFGSMTTMSFEDFKKLLKRRDVRGKRITEALIKVGAQLFFPSVKTASSRLRSAVEVVKGDHGMWNLMLGPQRAGWLQVLTDRSYPVAKNMAIDPAFQGMGLGKKLMGEVMSRYPGASLASDAILSPGGARLWSGMARRGYETEQVARQVSPIRSNFPHIDPAKISPEIEGITSHGHRGFVPVFRARLPEKAQRSMPLTEMEAWAAEQSAAREAKRALEKTSVSRRGESVLGDPPENAPTTGSILGDQLDKLGSLEKTALNERMLVRAFGRELEKHGLKAHDVLQEMLHGYGKVRVPEDLARRISEFAIEVSPIHRANSGARYRPGMAAREGLFLSTSRRHPDLMHHGLQYPRRVMAVAKEESPRAYALIKRLEREGPMGTTNLDEAARVMMSGRHTSDALVKKVPKTVDPQTGKAIPGPALNPEEVAYKGSARGLKYNPFDAAPGSRWVSAHPDVSAGYARSPEPGRLVAYDLSKTPGAGPWTPHIAREATRTDAARAKVGLLGQNAGRSGWGKSPTYERVIPSSELEGAVLSEYKMLPTGEAMRVRGPAVLGENAPEQAVAPSISNLRKRLLLGGSAVLGTGAVAAPAIAIPVAAAAGAEKAAAYAPGLPSKKKRTDPPKLTSSQTMEFVTQLHHAHKAGPHIDLRIGDTKSGIAHSWVLPKVIVPKPGEKVLAVQQPDHTLRYMDFRGLIGRGYGAGTVKAVDRLQTEVHHSEPGKMKFRLDRGRGDEEFILRRTGKHDQSTKWLLQNVTKTASPQFTFKSLSSVVRSVLKGTARAPKPPAKVTPEAVDRLWALRQLREPKVWMLPRAKPPVDAPWRAGAHQVHLPKYHPELEAPGKELLHHLSSMPKLGEASSPSAADALEKHASSCGERVLETVRRRVKLAAAGPIIPTPRHLEMADEIVGRDSLSQGNWLTFQQRLQRSPGYRQAVLLHPQADAKLKRHVRAMGALHEGTHLRKVQSLSGPQKYQLKLMSSGRLGCTCPDWRYRKSHGGGDCKHVRAFRSAYDAGEMPRGYKGLQNALEKASSVVSAKIIQQALDDMPRVLQQAVKRYPQQTIRSAEVVSHAPSWVKALMPQGLRQQVGQAGWTADVMTKGVQTGDELVGKQIQRAFDKRQMDIWDKVRSTDLDVPAGIKGMGFGR
jgi:ribosomal protein S18 acetylase RimI-like enzyme